MLCRTTYMSTRYVVRHTCKLVGMAGKRSDAKQKMVVAARQLIRERGYHATALSDVLERSEAPRGSVYFHFPGGKAELAVAAAEHHAREQIDHIAEAARSASSAADVVRSYLTQARDRMIASDYREGCSIAPIVIEGELGDLGGRLFASIIGAMAERFSALGVRDAQGLAEAVIAGAQGALVTARALRSPTPFDSVLGVLEEQAGRG
jgi:TetR/AcrR family transcriptional repressor of lmrAB and yxaGH operons